ncbi:MAG: alkaline phosphatase, partial [Planctomycetes bacterium]|nr:alkaline phosphatase [Planctomycetota bacterium]
MPHRCVRIGSFLFLIVWGLGATPARAQTDLVRELQRASVIGNVSGDGHWAHWGPIPEIYMGWGSHSNRLIPVYTFGTKGAGTGVDLADYQGENSVYRSAAELERIYGRVPPNTLNPQAEYLDQTDIGRIQRAGLTQGKKYIFLVVFDGMDWQTTWAAATYNRQKVSYRSGRGEGTHFQEYPADGTTQYGFMVTSPYSYELEISVDRQAVGKPKREQFGGYNPQKLGPNPWTPGNDWLYPIGKSINDPHQLGEHTYPDSAATATAMCAAVKIPNDAINVDFQGRQLTTIAHEAQTQGRSVGVVTSVPFSHATPACAYAHNVHRDDYQDLTRDLLGLPSVSHPGTPLPGVDVLLGGGFGDELQVDKKKSQGENFVPGNKWITPADLRAIDVERGGKYVVAQRTRGVRGRDFLAAQANVAAEQGQRLFGMFGAIKGHLPYQTADGHYDPTVGNQFKAEEYIVADIEENPKLSDMT